MSDSSSPTDSTSSSPPSPKRLRDQLQRLNPQQRLALLASLPEPALLPLLYDWEGLWARDSQLLPGGTWSTWLCLAGRGWGKTHVGSETVRTWVDRGEAGRIALIGPTSADARDVMVEGKSGILTLAPPWNKPRYEPSKRRLTWKNGARAFLYSAEEPERLRGPQHDKAWCDELAAWVNGKEVWNQLQMGLRLGDKPQAIATTTPKAVPLVLDLMKDPTTTVTRGSTFENLANPAEYFATIRRLYEGTRLGRQEIYAEVLEDMPGALFNQAVIDKLRVEVAPQLERIVVAIDPAPTSDAGADETGIIVVGRGTDEHVYVLADVSVRGTPDEWARAAVKAYYQFQADSLVAEVNVGGEMVGTVIRSVDPDVAFKEVRAMRGKAKRAEPVAALYEQGKVHHVGPPERFERLERQMRVFTGVNGRRDDRTDGLCWGVHELVVAGASLVFL